MLSYKTYGDVSIERYLPPSPSFFPQFSTKKFQDMWNQSGTIDVVRVMTKPLGVFLTYVMSVKEVPVLFIIVSLTNSDYEMLLGGNIWEKMWNITSICDYSHTMQKIIQTKNNKIV